MLTAAAALGLVASAPAGAAPRPAPAIGEETYIPFPGNGIRSWHAEDDYGLWVIDHRRRWYRVELMRPCVGLPYSYAIGFKTRGTGRFDRTSAITYQGQNCPVRSVVRSEAPPEKKRKAERKAAQQS